MPSIPTSPGLFYLPGNTATPNDNPLPADTIQMSGGSQPHDNIMPTLAINYIIALEGIFPSQN